MAIMSMPRQSTPSAKCMIRIQHCTNIARCWDVPSAVIALRPELKSLWLSEATICSILLDYGDSIVAMFASKPPSSTSLYLLQTSWPRDGHVIRLIYISEARNLALAMHNFTVKSQVVCLQMVHRVCFAFSHHGGGIIHEDFKKCAAKTLSPNSAVQWLLHNEFRAVCTRTVNGAMLTF